MRPCSHCDEVRPTAKILPLQWELNMLALDRPAHARGQPRQHGPRRSPILERLYADDAAGKKAGSLNIAYWVTRHGFEPTIIEKAPHLRTGGYIIDFLRKQPRYRTAVAGILLVPVRASKYLRMSPSIANGPDPPITRAARHAIYNRMTS